MSKLKIIPSHIGNISDISTHIVESIKECDFIACEDTRVTGILLKKLGIEKKEFLSYTEFNQQKKTPYIAERILKGEVGGLMTDAGTPLVSDPGFYLVRECIEKGIIIESVPGPSAVITALTGSGLPTDSFAFYGFLPKKEGKKKEKLKEAMLRNETAIFFESPYRIDKTLTAISELEGERRVVVARELTKRFEEYIRGTASDILEAKWERKGEIVLLIYGGRIDK